jgi:formamidopyrimidine-DNA glycosylase
MPELPDVETVARMLARRLRGRRITSARLLTPPTVRHPDPATFLRLMRGRRILDIGRRGKYLLIGLDRDLTLAVHLRMTGDFEVTPRRAPVHPHTRVIFSLGDAQLRFTDLRRFGHMDLLTPRQLAALPALARMGVEPLGPEFTLDRFREIVRTHRLGVKALLLRQDLIAGIGNLYADEILWQARLHPARSTASLRPARVLRLHRVIRAVLSRAVRLLSRYGRAVGVFLDAREREGRCPRCRHLLRVARVAGRTTYYCPRCQR